MIVQTMDGINQVPIEDIDLLLVSTTQAVITTALISELESVLKDQFEVSSASGPVRNRLERGGHGFKPVAQVLKTDLCLGRQRTPANTNFTPEPISDWPSSLHELYQ